MFMKDFECFLGSECVLNVLECFLNALECFSKSLAPYRLDHEILVVQARGRQGLILGSRLWLYYNAIICVLEPS